VSRAGRVGSTPVPECRARARVARPSWRVRARHRPGNGLGKKHESAPLGEGGADCKNEAAFVRIAGTPGCKSYRGGASATTNVGGADGSDRPSSLSGASPSISTAATWG